MDALMLFAASESVMDQIASWAWVILGVGGGLGFVIFVHELGHFLVAKACGVKCEKFYIGFDLFNLRFCRFKWGETEYGIGVLPLGGYVKMLGQDDDPRQAMAEMERCKVANEAEAARTQALAEGTASEGLTPGQSVEKPQAAPAQKYELDPRSYPAKPVLARMAIISAGVTMNVIFGVLLAAWAYYLGVPESPAIVGSTVPGSPAWTANLRPGMRFIAFGEGEQPYEHYRFEDVQRNVAFTGDDRKIEFVVRTRDGEQETFSIQPSSRAIQETKLPTVGFQSAISTEISEWDEKLSHLKADTDVPLKAGDVIVAINGIELKKPTPRVDAFDLRLQEELALSFGKPVTLTIERTPKEDHRKQAEKPKPQRLEVVVQPKPRRVLGFEMKLGPVVAVREGSPAQKAGLLPKDVIQKINGQSLGDPLGLSQRWIPKSDSEVWTVLISRTDEAGKTRTHELSVTPEMPEQFTDDYPLGGPVAIESLGVACDVTRTIAAVQPGSMAEAAGFKPGDVVLKAKFQAASRRKEDLEEEIFKSQDIHGEMVLDDGLNSWTRFDFRLQTVLPDTKVLLTIERSGRQISLAVGSAPSSTLFLEGRGIPFTPVVVTHQAASLSEALYLGGREVKERMFEVVETIGALGSGRVSFQHLSGPAGIIYAAGKFAEEGLPRLLIFLTILSANLAVLNFLPIPVLDGGHMLFLAWEGITRKPVNPNVQGYLSLAGLVLLLSLMIFATAMDFNRFFS